MELALGNTKKANWNKNKRNNGSMPPSAPQPPVAAANKNASPGNISKLLEAIGSNITQAPAPAATNVAKNTRINAKSPPVPVPSPVPAPVPAPIEVVTATREVTFTTDKPLNTSQEQIYLDSKYIRGQLGRVLKELSVLKEKNATQINKQPPVNKQEQAVNKECQEKLEKMESLVFSLYKYIVEMNNAFMLDPPAQATKMKDIIKSFYDNPVLRDNISIMVPKGEKLPELPRMDKNKPAQGNKNKNKNKNRGPAPAPAPAPPKPMGAPAPAQAPKPANKPASTPSGNINKTKNGPKEMGVMETLGAAGSAVVNPIVNMFP